MKPILLALASIALILSCNEQPKKAVSAHVKEIKQHTTNNQSDQETNNSRDLKGKKIPMH